MKKIFKIILIVVIAAFIVFAVTQGVRLYKYKKKASAITIEVVDLSQVRDGIYQGDYDLDYVNATVAVMVKAGKIEEIKIVKHKNERGAEAEKQIPKMIIERQTVKVDAISGATNSSRAIMKAVELALKAGLK